MKKFYDKAKAYAPALSVVLVTACAAASLSGYQAPTFAAEESTDEAADEDIAETAEEETAKGSFDLEDGVYQGTGTGFSGDITVAVQIKDKQIVSIDILSSSDDEAFFNRAKAVIDRIIEAQSLDVDVVSGATYSSNGIISAVKNALTGEKDSGETGASRSGSTGQSTAALETVADAAAYKDGTYYGTGTGFAGMVRVQVVISGGKIASVQVVQHSDGSSYMQKASGLISNIIATQSTNVDTVSGATFSSKGIILAVRNALSQAAVAGSSSSTATDTNTTQKSEETDSKEGTVPYDDGIYYGTAEGYQGDIKVAVVLQDHTIKAILVEESQDDETFFSRAMDVVKNVIRNQNTEVDTVSGATYSSKGLLNAIKNALKEAEKATNGEGPGTDVDTEALDAAVAAAEALTSADYTDASWAAVELRLADAKEALAGTDQDAIDKALTNLNAAVNVLVKKDGGDDGTVYKNGTYEVTVVCSPDEDEDFEAYNLSAKVTIRGDKIVGITDVAGDGGSGNDSYIKKAANGTSAAKGVVAQIVAKGTADDIDTVSHATCTSKALIELVEKAFEMAKQ